MLRCRLTIAFLVLAMLAFGCGNDKDKSGGNGGGGSFEPLSICTTDAHYEASVSHFTPLDHDGGSSDLQLVWRDYTSEYFICGGDWTFTLRARNASQHTTARRIWFTVIFYRGNEYVRDYSVTPQGIDLPVGESKDFAFTVRVDEAFSGAENRDIVAAVIIQTDNPNWDDPDAFFTRTWVRMLPASNCETGSWEQPARHNIAIHSVTCKDKRIWLQTHRAMMNSFPRSEVIQGPAWLAGDVWEEDGFYYQAVHITDHPTPEKRTQVDMLSSEADRIHFYFRERVDCDILRREREEDNQPPEEDDGDVGGVTPPPTELDDPPPAPEQSGTIIRTFAQMSACGATLPGSVVPPPAGPVSGTVKSKTHEDGKFELEFDLHDLPEPAFPQGQGWAAPVADGVFVAWLAAREGERTHMVPLGALDWADGRGQLKVIVEPEAVMGLGGSLGTWVGAVGVLEEAATQVPLQAFDSVIITLQPRTALDVPNGLFMGTGTVIHGDD